MWGENYKSKKGRKKKKKKDNETIKKFCKTKERKKI